MRPNSERYVAGLCLKKKKKRLQLNNERVVSLIMKMSLKTELWKLKIVKFSVSITHNSKIKKLSDRNKKWK